MIQQWPEVPAAHNNLGSTLRLLGDDQAAVASFRTALRLDPEYPEACNNIGTALCHLGQAAEGEELLRRAVALRPAYARAHCNLGRLLREKGDIPGAEACFRTALRHAPELAEAHLNLSNALLLRGRFAEAWEDFEWRLRLPGTPSPPVALPAWRGEPLGERTLLVRASEGFGDTIQFCRYVPLLAPALPVVFQVQRPLQRLLQSLVDGLTIVTDSDPLPACDVQCDLLSLPYLFGTTLETLPVAPAYLRAPPDHVAFWRHRLGSLSRSRKLQVGLVWSGNPSYPADRQRSIEPDRLAVLDGVPGISFVCLQVPRGRLPAGLEMHDPTQVLGDFADTAALVSALDLVIGVDTAVVHLAGALGRPVWLLNRFDTDWRWLLDRADSPWYPTLRQFRQTHAGDWDSVLQAVRAALLELPGRPGSAGDLAFQEAIRQHEVDRLVEAERGYRDVLAIWPEHYPSLHQLGLIALRCRQPETAIDLFARAVGQVPGEASAINNLGNAFRETSAPAEAVVCYREALRLRPNDAKTLSNLGLALADLGEMAEAEERCRQALALQSDLPDLHMALAWILLSIGRLIEGWPEFIWRRRIAGHVRRFFEGAEWQGEPVGDRTLLLHSDEGVGDAIQCIRYLPLLGARAIVLDVQPELVRLFSNLPGAAGGLVKHVAATGKALPPVQLHRPLLDLPGLLDTTLEMIPAAVPYLQADAGLALRWHRRLAHLPGLRVGVAWSGNRANLADTMRSMPLVALLPLFAAFPEVDFISLQKGDGRDQMAGLTGCRLLDFAGELNDFADTAALMEALDLVIAVDTAVVHLAGALGKPVWLLNRFNSDWRWLIGRDDSPWYPTLRQFRQAEIGDWGSVVVAVTAALREFVAVP